MAFRSKKRVTAEKYRKTFKAAATPEDAEWVLVDILFDLGFFDTPRNEKELELHNAAKRLLAKMGVWDALNVTQLTRAFLATPINEETYGPIDRTVPTPDDATV